jgi:hypothetical protein
MCISYTKTVPAIYQIKADSLAGLNRFNTNDLLPSGIFRVCGLFWIPAKTCVESGVSNLEAGLVAAE